jgi:DNA-binding YbaB/EbfC family protein
MKDMNALMRQAQAMQARLQEAQAKLAVTVFQGEAGNGLVKLSLTGGGELGAVMIDPQLLDPDDPETLADLIVGHAPDHGPARRRPAAGDEVLAWPRPPAPRSTG